MTRFIMSLEEATALVIESMVYAHGGETFITKMPSMRIVDLAMVMIDILAPLYGHKPKDIEVRIVGGRPGEKLWEELSTDEESRRILEGDRYLCVLPSVHDVSGEVEKRYEPLGLKRSSCVYNSNYEPKMSELEIAEFLMLDGVLPEHVRDSLVDFGYTPSAQASFRACAMQA